MMVAFAWLIALTIMTLRLSAATLAAPPSQD